MTDIEQRAAVFRRNLNALLGPRYSPRSRKALAAYLGVPLYRVSRMASGKTPIPERARCEAIADFFEIAYQDLFDPELTRLKVQAESTMALRRQVIRAVSELNSEDAHGTLAHVLALVRGESVNVPARNRPRAGTGPTPRRQLQLERGHLVASI